MTEKEYKRPPREGEGRPSTYSQEICDKICEQLALGRSLRTVCKGEDMPSMATIFKWMREHDEFLKQYTKAKEESSDALTDEMLDIADNATNDRMAKNDPNNEGYIANGDHIQRSRLRIETRKRIASKLKPKKYGDKIGIGGADDLPPIKVDNLSELSTEELLALSQLGTQPNKTT